MTTFDQSGTYVVIGATGAQGGAVAAALLSRGLPVRAVVRRPDSAGALRLADRGAELAVADLDDAQSLAAAFAGAAGVFALTTPFERGPEEEVTQGRSIIEAASSAGVGHLVFSSVASADQHTGVPHFESKVVVEAALAASGIAHTIVGPTYFYDNLLGGIDQVQQGVLDLPLPPDVPLQQLSRRDLGEFVATVFGDPQRFLGVRIDIASDNPTPTQMAASLSRRLGREVRLHSGDPAQIESPDMRAMFGFLAATGYSADLSGLRQNFPEVGWQSFDAWVDQAL
ncbi:MAG: NmrA family transcriptional regulator [Gordonia sp.]|nr:NmrA family transcriptional regulator [Gordonia sp. (in: high G+C Gram-positive bacteria)]